jgi:outer membrane lipoprotein-sorting protein
VGSGRFLGALMMVWVKVLYRPACIGGSEEIGDLMNKKTMYGIVAAIVIVVVVIAVAGAYVLMNNGGGAGNSANVASATSLQYTISATNSSGASQGSYVFYAKDAGTSNMKMRIEFTNADGATAIYIVNGAEQKAWVSNNGVWADVSTSYSTVWDSWNSQWTAYKNSLSAWSGTGDYVYTDSSGNSVKISNISVNPTLDDSLFSHS